MIGSLHEVMMEPLRRAARRKAEAHQKLRRMYRGRLSDKQKPIHSKAEFLKAMPRWAMLASYKRHRAQQKTITFKVSDIVFDFDDAKTTAI
jgi:hypothetical protein